MITIQGKGESKGIAKGPLYFFQRPDTTVALKAVTDVESEKPAWPLLRNRPSSS